MAKVLISTVYSADSIVLAITKLSIDRLFLISDLKINREQQKNIKRIQDSFGKVIDIRERRTEVYNIVSITKSIVDLIDSIPTNEEIYVNITPSRKTQAIGLLFAAYKRSMRIKKIYYIIEENRKLISLPILSFDLSESQIRILELIEEYENKGEGGMTKLAKDLGISRAMLYRNIKSLKDRGMIEQTSEGLRLTDAGKLGIM